MQCPPTPPNVFGSQVSIPSSPLRGRYQASAWSLHKNNDALAEYDEVTKAVPNGGNRPKSRGLSAPLTPKSGAKPTLSKLATKSPCANSPKPRYSKQTNGTSSNINTKAKDYQNWSFGKTKKFDKPAVTTTTTKAVVTLQRLVRGWMARLKFKLSLLQYKLSHKHELTMKAMEQMEDGVKRKKQYERKKLEDAFKAKAKEEEKKLETEHTVEEGKDIIAYLRNENKKLRDKNDRILKAAFNLKAQNDRLEGVNTQTDGNMGILSTHAKQIEETNKKLNHVVPKYQISVAQLSSAAEQHRQYCLMEHNIKLMYVKLIGTIVDMLEERNKTQPELTDEIVGYVLAMEGKDNDKPLPEQLPTGNERADLPDQKRKKNNNQTTVKGQQSASNPYQNNKNSQHPEGEDEDTDSEDYDEYSVATFD